MTETTDERYWRRRRSNWWFLAFVAFGLGSCGVSCGTSLFPLIWSGDGDVMPFLVIVLSAVLLVSIAVAQARSWRWFGTPQAVAIALASGSTLAGVLMLLTMFSLWVG